MGCASSAALPFRTGGKVAGTDKQNGGVDTLAKSAENINQGVIGGKYPKMAYDDPADSGENDGFMHQIHGVGDAMVKKVSMAVQDIEDNVGSAFGKLKHGAEDVMESVEGGVKNATDKIQESLGAGHEVADKLEEEAKAAEDSVQSKVDAFQELMGDEAEKAAEKVKEVAKDAEEKVEEIGANDSIDDLIASLTEKKEEKEKDDDK